ncbi:MULTISPECIES: hypothetical protein [unclassified Oleiphilus]|nr:MULTISPECIES: hypothetical protein [unclassified Oleiphilus]MCH2158409.1 hypothetical protein [Oleiphilaceae bacterium]
MFKKSILSLAAASFGFSGNSFAYQESDIIVRGGAAKVSSDASSGLIGSIRQHLAILA